MYCKYQAQCWSAHLCSISTTFHTIKFSRLLLLLRLLDFCSFALVCLPPLLPPPCPSLVLSPCFFSHQHELRFTRKKFFYIQLAFMSFHEFQFHWFFIRLKLGIYLLEIGNAFLCVFFFLLFFRRLTSEHCGVWRFWNGDFQFDFVSIYKKERICKYSP